MSAADDVRPLFDAWQTARTAAVRAADPQYEDRQERALRAIARGMIHLAAEFPALTADKALCSALHSALFTTYL